MEQAVLVVASAFLFYIAWYDFQTLKIRNVFVVILIGIYAVFSVVTGFATLKPDLVAGGVLFVMAFIFWLFGLLGAGDAKLYFPVGLFLGTSGLVIYLILLLGFSVLTLLIIRVGGKPRNGAGPFRERLVMLREAGRVPYSVPMAVATVVVIWLKAVFMPI